MKSKFIFSIMLFCLIIILMQGNVLGVESRISEEELEQSKIDQMPIVSRNVGSVLRYNSRNVYLVKMWTTPENINDEKVNAYLYSNGELIITPNSYDYSSNSITGNAKINLFTSSYWKDWKDYKNQIKIVKIEGIEGIGSSAFQECKNLIKVEGLFEESPLIKVNSLAFYGCTSLEVCDMYVEMLYRLSWFLWML